MLTDHHSHSRELFDLLIDLSREIRCCSRDEAICRGLTFQQFVILDAVAKNGELALSDLHGILSVEKSTTTRLVNPLVQRRLLKRERASHDSRAVTLMPTKQGVETHREVWLCLRGFFEAVIRHIPAANREKVMEDVKLFAAAMHEASVECRCCR